MGISGTGYIGNTDKADGGVRIRSFVERLQIARIDLAVGAPLQIRIKVFPILLHHLARTEVAHTLVDASAEYGAMKFAFIERFECVDQRRADEAFLLGAVTAFPG
jgi:hypothetical protein